MIWPNEAGADGFRIWQLSWILQCVGGLCASVAMVSTGPAVETVRVEIQDAIPDAWRWQVFDKRSGLAGNVHDVFEGRDGSIWFATDRGVQRYDGYEWTSYTVEDGLHSNQVLTGMQTRDGVVWFGGMDAISRFDGSSWLDAHQR